MIISKKENQQLAPKIKIITSDMIVLIVMFCETGYGTVWTATNVNLAYHQISLDIGVYTLIYTVIYSKAGTKIFVNYRYIPFNFL